MSEELTTMGKITSTYGVKGWVKVMSYTQPKENIASYPRWLVTLGGRQQGLEVESCKAHGNGMVAKLKGYEDREAARLLAGTLVQVRTAELPPLEEGECYWHQLEGLTVVTVDGRCLGRVAYLMETGANDVLVVKPDAQSIDVRERLVPYLPDQVVKDLDLEKGVMTVDWDPEF